MLTTPDNHRVISESGTGLIELMGAMVAGLIILGATLHALSYFRQDFGRLQEHLTQQQDVRLGLELFEQEVHLAGDKPFTIVGPDAVEFSANVNGLITHVTATATSGQTTLAVEDARGWPDNKLVQVCWNEQCESFTLARSGQRNLLTLLESLPRTVPSGASVMVMNRVRYYTRTDEHGSLRFLRQIDGGASVIAGNIETVEFSYWDAQGRKTLEPDLIRRIVVTVSLPRRPMKHTKEISLRR